MSKMIDQVGYWKTGWKLIIACKNECRKVSFKLWKSSSKIYLFLLYLLIRMLHKTKMYCVQNVKINKHFDIKKK